jgi:hypothetical protein
MTRERAATSRTARTVARRIVAGTLVPLLAVVIWQAVAPATVFGYATLLPVPKGESGLNEEVVTSIACTSAGRCEAAGSYEEKQPIVVNEVGGKWASATKISLPTNAAAGGGVLTSIACSSPGNCAATGTYQSTFFNTAPMLVTEAAGVWARAIAAPLPPNAASGPHAFAFLSGVSCSSTADCVAVGNTQTTSNPIGEAFVDTGSGASWTASTPPMPTGSVEGVLNAVTCSSTGCEAVGASETESGPLQLVGIAEAGGTWSQGVVIAPPSGARLGQDQFELEALMSVSCPDVGSCVAAGLYDTAHGGEPFVAVESQGTWGVGHETTVPIGAAKFQSASIAGIACSSILHCVAVGGYELPDKAALGMTLNEVGGVWQRAVASPLPAGGGESATNTGVACPTVSTCATVGWFQDASGVRRSFAASPATAPGRAIIRGVVARSGGFVITIRAPLSTGGLPIESYQYSLDGGSSWLTRSSASTPTKLTIGSLAPNHRYRLAVRAVTGAGVGTASNVVVATTG